jgi:hypothetical protein
MKSCHFSRGIATAPVAVRGNAARTLGNGAKLGDGAGESRGSDRHACEPATKSTMVQQATLIAIDLANGAPAGSSVFAAQKPME